MTIPAVTAGSTIDPAWGNAVADSLNLTEITDQDGSTKYAIRAVVLGSITTDGTGFFSVTPADVGLTTIVGAVLTMNYTAVAGAPSLQGLRLTAGNLVGRVMKMTDGTAFTSASIGTGHFCLAWGTV